MRPSSGACGWLDVRGRCSLARTCDATSGAAARREPLSKVLLHEKSGGDLEQTLRHLLEQRIVGRGRKVLHGRGLHREVCTTAASATTGST